MERLTTLVSSRVLQEIVAHQQAFPLAELQTVAELVISASRIYVYGTGRTGLVLDAFAMRLAQMGYCCFIGGHTTTTAIRPGDVLLVASKSGETASVLRAAGKAVEHGAAVLMFTAQPTAVLSGVRNLTLPGAPSLNHDLSTAQPLGSLFEQCLFLYLDELVLHLMVANGIESSVLAANHANLE